MVEAVNMSNKNRKETNGNSSEGPYCICNSYEESEFMIHMAINLFVDKSNGLVIFPKYPISLGFSAGCCDSCERWFHNDCMNIKSSKSAKKMENFFCPPCIQSNAHLKVLHAKKKKRKLENAETSSREKLVKKIKRRDCNECIACFRTVNCGLCDICTSESSSGARCRMRECVNPIEVEYECKPEQSPSPPAIVEQPPPPEPEKSSSSIQKSDTIRKKRSSHDGNIAQRKPKLPNSTTDSKRVKSSLRAKVVATKRNKVKHEKQQNDDDAYLVLPRDTRSSTKKFEQFMKEACGKVDSVEEEEEEVHDVLPPRHCIGPDCVYAARANSKYCSQECVMKLARARLLTILPGRIQQWYSTPSQAQANDVVRLQQIRLKQEEMQKCFLQLDGKQARIERWIADAKQCKMSSFVMESDDEDGDSLYSCFICGNDVPCKLALKHSYKCYAKQEMRVSYGTAYPSRNMAYDLFCDAYNKSTQTYCKRLKRVCPEHAKEAKAEQNEICGCPLNVNRECEIFHPSRACLVPKQKCLKHCYWDRVQLGLIDKDRLQMLLRMEELSEEEIRLNMVMRNRGNVLDLLLYQTTYHTR
ncbi:putative CpG-binding protein [Trichinella spiralis]|uniref:putative CpG-binding protein n=1 Tax=Trichinella spiralis TaxID=6334 RepID=UPI0001EFD0A2|nr:putative CpG-binding protein [Trichinella spiralis]